MAAMCCMVGCSSLGTKSCSTCRGASYCSVTCQREDWKGHKQSCVDVNSLPTNFLPKSQVDKYIKKIYAKTQILNSENKFSETIHALQKCLVFIGHQNGAQIEGTSYCRRSNGDRIDNVELVHVRITLAELSDIVLDFDAVFTYATEARRILEHRDKSDDFNLLSLALAERLIAAVYIYRKAFDTAEYHCEQCMMFVKLIQDEIRISSEYQALKTFAYIRSRTSRLLEAIDYSEQAYAILSRAYEPVHPEVLECGSMLINYLIENKDFSKADNFCRMNYENLKHPRSSIDSPAGPSLVSEAMMQIAGIWLRKDPVDDEEAALALAEEAEDLARKALQLTAAISGQFSPEMASGCSIFGHVLLKREKYTEETRLVLEHWVALDRRKLTFLDSCLDSSLATLARFHHLLGEIMPPGDERNRELQLGDEYLGERDLFLLREV